MTICIATIDEMDNGKHGIVFCADRLISSYVNFEHGNSKIRRIINRGITMEAGDGTLSDLVLDEEILKSSAELSILEIAKKVNKKLIKLKQEKIETKILSKYCLDYKTFIQEMKNLPDGIVFSIMQAIDSLTASLELEFIIAGINKNGNPDIFIVSVQEGIQCLNNIGFAAIGSGQPLSLMELTKSAHSTHSDETTVIVKTYSAKKHAERVSGVGSMTDLGVIEPLGSGDNVKARVFFFDDIFKNSLDEELKKIQNSENKIMRRIKEDIDKVTSEHDKHVPPKEHNHESHATQ